MAKVGETLSVEAPVDVVWGFLVRTVEGPQDFCGGVYGAEMFVRVDGMHGRTVATELGVRTERMQFDDEGRELSFEMIDDTPCTGRIVARVFDNPGIGNMLSFLEYEVELEPRGRNGDAFVAAAQDEVRETMAAVKAKAEATPR
jgi:hypothetical protein